MILKKPLKFPIPIQKNIEQRIKNAQITTIDNNKCGNCRFFTLNKKALFCKKCGFLFINRLKGRLA